MLKIAIAGCNGKMGKCLVQSLNQTTDMRLGAASLSKHHPLLNNDVGVIAGLLPLGVTAVDDLAAVIDNFDILIDFTTPQASLAHLKICEEAQKKWVIGTTGFTLQERQLIAKASESISIVFSPNMSRGVHLTLQLLKEAAKKLGKEADIHILETHHRHKVDAPSGTALKMQQVITSSCAPQVKEVACSSVRAGDIAGDHTVVFAWEGERLEITHRAANRTPFALGALTAARWLASKPAGLYSMEDVLSA